MVLAGLMLTVMLSLVKVARSELGALDVMFWRGATSVPLAFLFARRKTLRLHNVRLFLLRAALGFGAMVGFFTAARGLAVAELSLITKLQPILVAVFAALLLGAGERIGPQLWLVLAGGFTGCALILSPGLEVGATWGLWALAATALSAGAHVCLRALSRTDDSRVIVLYFMLAVTALAAGARMLLDGAPPALPPAHLWPHVLGIGLAATAGQMLMTQAYAEDRAAVVAAASYVAPLWAVGADLLAFGTTPTLQMVIGGVVIVGGGLYLLLSSGRTAAPAVTEEDV